MAQDPKCLRQWRALGALMRRRWLERAWVFQEAVLARKAMFCGGRTILSDADMLDGFQALWHAGNRHLDTFSKGDGVKLNVPTRVLMNGMTRVRGARLDEKTLLHPYGAPSKYGLALLSRILATTSTPRSAFPTTGTSSTPRTGRQSTQFIPGSCSTITLGKFRWISSTSMLGLALCQACRAGCPTRRLDSGQPP